MAAPEPSLFRLSYKTRDLRLRQLAECYWASYRDRDGRIRFKYGVVKDLAPRFGLRATAASVTGPVMDAATAFYGRCPRCDAEMGYAHRTAFSESHHDLSRGKPCWRCQRKEQRALTLARRRAIRRAYRPDPFRIDVPALTLRDTLFALAVLRASGFSGSRRLTTYGLFPSRLSPSLDFDRDILVHLYRRGITAVDPNSPEESFVLDQHGKAHRYYPTHVRWLLNDTDLVQFATGIEQSLKRRAYPAAWNAELRTLSEEIARHECLDCFVMLRRVNGLRWELPPEWRSVISQALGALSVSEILPLIFRAVKETYHQVQVPNETPPQRGAAFVGKLGSIIEQVLNDSKPAETFPRYPQCPRSMVSVVLYQTLLHAGDDGFTKPPAAFTLLEEKPVPPPPDYVPWNEMLIQRAIELSKLEQDRSTPVSFGGITLPSPLLVYLAGLSALDRAQVAAVMLIGRGDEEPEDFDEVVQEWTRPMDSSLAEYLAAKKPLWKFLETGLDKLAELMAF